MAGVWRRTMKYLGLVEDDELDEMESAAPAEEAERAVPALATAERGTPARRSLRGAAPAMDTAPSVAAMRRVDEDSVVRTIAPVRASGTIHRAEPKRFNEARELGERYKDGVPVIMNLQGTDDPIARRLVDFASGLVFAQDGKIELVANRVYLMTPRDVEVSAEERERIREGGFYNQF